MGDGVLDRIAAASQAIQQRKAKKEFKRERRPVNGDFYQAEENAAPEADWWSGAGGKEVSAPKDDAPFEFDAADFDEDALDYDYDYDYDAYEWDNTMQANYDVEAWDPKYRSGDDDGPSTLLPETSDWEPVSSARESIQTSTKLTLKASSPRPRESARESLQTSTKSTLKASSPRPRESARESPQGSTRLSPPAPRVSARERPPDSPSESPQSSTRVSSPAPRVSARESPRSSARVPHKASSPRPTEASSRGITKKASPSRSVWDDSSEEEWQGEVIQGANEAAEAASEVVNDAVPEATRPRTEKKKSPAKRRTSRADKASLLANRDADVRSSGLNGTLARPKLKPKVKSGPARAATEKSGLARIPETKNRRASQGMAPGAQLTKPSAWDDSSDDDIPKGKIMF